MLLTKIEKEALQKTKDSKPKKRKCKPDGAQDLANRSGINRNTIRQRLRAGMTPGEAISAPIKSRKECGQAAAKKRWGK